MPDEPSLPPPPPPLAPAGARWPAGPPLTATRVVDVGQLHALRSLSIAVMALVGLVAVVNLASIPNDLAYISNLQDIVDGGFGDINEIADQEDLRGTFAVAVLVTLVVAGVVWIVWQQRARACAEALGATGQRHSKALAACGWFIPIGNLFLPKQVTNDLWRASDPDGPPTLNVEGRPVWSVIDVWWAMWILGGVVGRVAFNATEPQTIDELDSYISDLRIELGVTVLTLVAAGLGILVVQRITTRLIVRAERAGVTV